MSMDKELIQRTIGPVVEELGCFIVEIIVSKDNDVTLTVEKTSGEVSLEDCVTLNDAFLATFDKDVEDYSLTVSSAGLDQPFKVHGQYVKAVGSQVIALLKGGRKLTGVLTGVDDDGINIRYMSKELPEGKKKRITVEREERLGFESINSVTPLVEFKK